MNNLYLTSNELDEYLDQCLLTLPTVFEECMSPEQQILWLLVHKQNLLVEGDNITLTPNEDGTVTISSEGGGATYRIESATPDEGYTAAYILKNVDTEEQAGVKIQVPTVAGPQGPQGETGPQGPAGPQGETGPQGPQGETGPQGSQGVPGQDGADGVGITSIIFKETDPSGNNVYTVTLTNGNTYDITCPIGPTGATGPQGATGPAGPGVPAGGTVGQVLKKSGSGDYETNWEDPSGGGFDPEYITFVNMYSYTASSPASGISNISPYNNYNEISYTKIKSTQDTYAYASGLNAHIMLSFRSTAQTLNPSNINFCTLTGQNVYSQTLYGTNNANTPLLNQPMFHAEILDNTGAVVGYGRATLNFTNENTAKISFRPFMNSISLTSGVTYYLHIY